MSFRHLPGTNINQIKLADNSKITNILTCVVLQLPKQKTTDPPHFIISEIPRWRAPPGGEECVRFWRIQQRDARASGRDPTQAWHSDRCNHRQCTTSKRVSKMKEKQFTLDLSQMRSMKEIATVKIFQYFSGDKHFKHPISQQRTIFLSLEMLYLMRFLSNAAVVDDYVREVNSNLGMKYDRWNTDNLSY